jgi:DNA-binding MarR family transcriptional regulator
VSALPIVNPADESCSVVNQVDDAARFVACVDDRRRGHCVSRTPNPQPSTLLAAQTMQRPRDPPLQRWRLAATALIDEITLAAERVGEARGLGGQRVFPTDAQARLLRAVERSPYCLAIADAARALGVSRQAAHRVAYRAAALGRLELLPNADDARILQLLLTPTGTAYLRALRTGESLWLGTLLNGLGDPEMATATHVVRVIRQRLERDARELAQRKAHARAQRLADAVARRDARALAQLEADELARRERIPLQSKDHKGDSS